MYKVKLTFNYDFPILRQTPKSSGKWRNYQFIIDDNLKECDFWIIYSDYELKEETVRCNPANVIFMPAEGYHTSPRFAQDFLDQFGAIITVQRELKHRNIIYNHNANPWYVGKTYDELNTIKAAKKTKLISVISSDKASTQGHRKRLDFVQKLKEHFGSQIHIYGRGTRDFEDKWDVLAPYKYSIAIENDNQEDWVTEKFFDCLLAYTFPIYYGCPNLEKYVPGDSFQRIDINDFESSVQIIEDLLARDIYSQKTKAIAKGRNLALNKENLFPLLERVLDNFNPDLKRTDFKFHANKMTQPRSFKGKVLHKMNLSLKKIYI